MSFTAVTWNILADAYIKPGRYDHVPAEALLPGPRRKLLLQQIREMAADLYCLQEVEPDSYRAIGEELGGSYGGLYEQKHGKPDGCAIFWRESAFQLSHREAIHFRSVEQGYDHLALVAFLVSTGHPARTLAAVSTHLRWAAPGSPPASHLGLLQMNELLQRRSELLDAWPCWLVCGDLNATSEDPPVRAAEAASLALSCRSQRPWDTTNIGGRKRKLDYLLYSPDHLRPSPRPLEVLSRDTPMPSLRLPSDHLPLVVDYRWVR